MNFKAQVHGFVNRLREDGKTEVLINLVTEPGFDVMAVLNDAMVRHKPVVVSADG